MLDKKNNLLRCAACRNGARAIDMAGRREAKITPFTACTPAARICPARNAKCLLSNAEAGIEASRETVQTLESRCHRTQPYLRRPSFSIRAR
ncbi:protein of unknown function [Cupriavidus taiwanensis]|uniref:Uncharacterized protein n=1 Tax=Cupriavidus taiwanensis TaxID=164546 RepID=A0A9Q7UPS6_9BURK|nr:protein of unknown function [Cupriavidus taiwanensis]